MKLSSNIVLLTGIASLSLANPLSRASILSVSPVYPAANSGEIILNPKKVLNGNVTNDHQQGFNEQQNVLLASPLAVDSGSIAAGTKVDSHMIFLNQVNVEGQDPKLVDTGVVWTFSGPILGVMSDNNGLLEAASSFLLGAT